MLVGMGSRLVPEVSSRSLNPTDLLQRREIESERFPGVASNTLLTASAIALAAVIFNVCARS